MCIASVKIALTSSPSPTHIANLDTGLTVSHHERFGSGKDIFHHVAVHVGQPIVAALVLERELRVVDAEQVQDRGLQVVDVDGAGRELVFGWRDWVAVVVGDVVAVVVGAAVGEAGLDAAAGEPDGEAAGVVVAAVVGRR